jgi:hypothetical protein
MLRYLKQYGALQDRIASLDRIIATLYSGICAIAETIVLKDGPRKAKRLGAIQAPRRFDLTWTLALR